HPRVDFGMSSLTGFTAGGRRYAHAALAALWPADCQCKMGLSAVSAWAVVSLCVERLGVAMYDRDTLKRLEEARARYEAEVAGILKKGGEAGYHTPSGIEVKPLYTPLDVPGTDYQRDISFPGQYPYTRGLFPAGFRSRAWNLRQVVGLGTAEETNQRCRYLLSQGQTALGIVGAVKSAMGGYGYDTDDERTIGFAGKDGVQIDTLADFETLFEGIDLDTTSVHLITPSAVALACYINLCQKRGKELHQIKGSMSNQVRPGRECLDIIEFCARHMPHFNATYIDVRNVREAGCTAPQEIAFGVAFGMAAADALLERGLTIDQFAPRVTWFVNAGPEFFEEVAKFRAMRRLWARVMRERYSAQDPRSCRMRAHCQTYAPSLTYQQPLNNIIRSTVYALAAVLGGVQSMSVNSFDEVLAIPTEFSATLSLRTQQIIHHETGVSEVVDPLGGAYYVEWLTNRLEEEAAKLLDTIQGMGGAFKAKAWMEQQVREAAFRQQKEMDEGKRVQVGVNAFVEEDDRQFKFVTSRGTDLLYRYDPTVRDKQIARLNRVKAQRDPAAVERARLRLREAFAHKENVLPAFVEATAAYMSGGEIARVCREVLGDTDDYFYYFHAAYFPAT
ncbi:MAG: methylmalonyl-CoA mutase family protein, partial [Chloroflexota bacterium]